MTKLGKKITPEWVRYSKLSNSTTDLVFVRSVTNNDGFVYTTGQFKGSVKIGQFNLQSTNLTPFIAKQDECGQYIFVKTGTVSDIGAIIGAAYGSSITIDRQNRLFLLGRFKGNLQFEGVDLLSNPHEGRNIYIIRLDPCTGEAIWSLTTTIDPTVPAQPFDAAPKVINSDDHNSLYIFGDLMGSFLFGNTPISSGNGTNRDVFLAKISKNGKFIWANQSMEEGATDLQNSGNGLAFSNCHPGKIYIIGNFRKLIKFSQNIFRSTGRDVFIMSADTKTGAWLTGTQTVKHDALETFGSAIVVYDNSLFATGYFSGTTEFGKKIFTTPVGVDFTCFISRLSFDFTFEKTIIVEASNNGTPHQKAINIALGLEINNNSIYFSGIFRDRAKFGNLVELISSPNYSGFITEFTPSLKFIAQFRSFNLDENGDLNQSMLTFPNPISADRLNRDSVYWIENFTGNINVGQFPLSSDTIKNPALLLAPENMFITKLDFSECQCPYKS
ncbi:MAG: collagen triple helix repeat containing protein [Hyperionvirus sp.]|uniref:Collagen triple helix repeat containing protein n=1 Tax=Hyperionvirus sp. TaxID=2487770 RepID=A0A3G5AAR5_9VIRU|nr:MAG: collagen triple helix repeat containing protein [Hyperionvirus sp.]